MTRLHAKTALTSQGWQHAVRVVLGDDGRIATIETGAKPSPEDESVDILLPAPANLHSHSFQRAMAGLTEYRGRGRDSFWTWRALMYRFLENLTPEQVEAIAAQVFVEMLEAGYGAVGEFHYLHHKLDGVAYDDPAEMGARIAAAAQDTGIGLTLLPVLYSRGGADGTPLSDAQRRFGCDLARFETLFEASKRAVAALPDDTALGVAPHSLRAVGPEALREVAMLAPEAPLHIHVAEQAAEVEEVEAALGARPVAWLLDNLEVDARWCLIHATQMKPGETVGLAVCGAVAGLCPITEANLGDGIFDGGRYVAAGGRFGVGSDSNVRIGLAEELRQLEYTQRLRSGERAVLSSPTWSVGRTLFERACEGGAQALGRASGAIAEGRLADLVSLDAKALALAERRGDRLLDGWIFAGDDRVIDCVWSAGRQMVRGGRHRGRARIEARFRTVMAELSEAL
ncbi:MAG: formimidoylglutamate deiminase [Pseudomonadota bacterium]